MNVARKSVVENPRKPTEIRTFRRKKRVATQTHSLTHFRCSGERFYECVCVRVKSSFFYHFNGIKLQRRKLSQAQKIYCDSLDFKEFFFHSRVLRVIMDMPRPMATHPLTHTHTHTHIH